MKLSLVYGFNIIYGFNNEYFDLYLLPKLADLASLKLEFSIGRKTLSAIFNETFTLFLYHVCK